MHYKRVSELVPGDVVAEKDGFLWTVFHTSPAAFNRTCVLLDPFMPSMTARGRSTQFLKTNARVRCQRPEEGK